MARTAAVLFTLILAAASLAQSADLATTIDAPDYALPGETFTVTGTVTNLGPDPAEHVMVSLAGSPQWCIDDVEIGTLQPNETRTFSCQGRMPHPRGEKVPKGRMRGCHHPNSGANAISFAREH